MAHGEKEADAGGPASVFGVEFTIGTSEILQLRDCLSKASVFLLGLACSRL